MVDNQHRQEQEDVEAVIIREDNKDNKKQKDNDDIQAWNEELEQDNLEQDNEHSTTTQESGDDDENESGDDDENDYDDEKNSHHWG